MHTGRTIFVIFVEVMKMEIESKFVLVANVISLNLTTELIKRESVGKSIPQNQFNEISVLNAKLGRHLELRH